MKKKGLGAFGENLAFSTEVQKKMSEIIYDLARDFLKDPFAKKIC